MTDGERGNERERKEKERMLKIKREWTREVGREKDKEEDTEDVFHPQDPAQEPEVTESEDPVGETAEVKAVKFKG